MAYRFKIQIPDVDYPSDGFPLVSCDPDSFEWESLSWSRWASGGNCRARHMFVDDWRLEHLWRKQGEGLAKVLFHDVVTSPDFTIETNYPLPLAAYQVWRSRVLTAYWQSLGCAVVPVLQWGNHHSFLICSHGIKENSVVAVRGPQRGTEDKWLEGMEFMIEQIKPSLVLHFGRKLSYSDDVIFYSLKG